MRVPRSFLFFFFASPLACVGDAPTQPPAEAGADVAIVPDATGDAGTGFCDTQAANVVLCEDFDHGPLAPRGWTDDPQLTPPSPTVVGSPTKSAPFALFSKSTTTPPTQVWARLTRTVNVGGATKKATLEADVLLDKVTFTGVGGQVIPLAIALGLAAVPPIMGLVVEETTWGCIATGQPVADAGQPFGLKAWHRVKLVAEVTGGTYNVTCTVDAKSVVVVGAGADGGAPSADRRVAIGHNAGGAVGLVELYTDDLVLRAE